jgi:hypothetical protein
MTLNEMTNALREIKEALINKQEYDLAVKLRNVYWELDAMQEAEMCDGKPKLESTIVQDKRFVGMMMMGMTLHVFEDAESLRKAMVDYSQLFDRVAWVDGVKFHYSKKVKVANENGS